MSDEAATSPYMDLLKLRMLTKAYQMLIAGEAVLIILNETQQPAVALREAMNAFRADCDLYQQMFGQDITAQGQMLFESVQAKREGE